MYAVYQSVIKAYILNKWDFGRIEYMDGLPVMFNYAGCIKPLEFVRTDDIFVCIEYVLGCFNIKTIKRVNTRTIRCGNEKCNVIIKEEYNNGLNFAYHLNDWPVLIKDDQGRDAYGLFSFLIDPLEFIRRNIKSIDDVHVIEFLLMLEANIKNFDIVHIKWLLIEELQLVRDINEMIRNVLNELVIGRINWRK